MLDTALSDADKYPLKLRDLLVMPLDSKKGPRSLVWGPKPSAALRCITPGLDGDKFYPPAFVDEGFDEYTGACMWIDPSGTGKDETAVSVVKHLNGMLFNTKNGAWQDGYGEKTLSEIAQIAKDQNVNIIKVEQNLGQGMFANLLMPYLAKIDHRCKVETERSFGQKEKRVIEVLEPVMAQHRLVIAEDAIEEDDKLVQGKPLDRRTLYRMFYQMTRLTATRGALAHDDRIEALASAVGYWVDQMRADQNMAAKRAHEKELEKAIAMHLKQQVVKIKDPYSFRKRRKSKGGFAGR
jgi:hypothetical protein